MESSKDFLDELALKPTEFYEEKIGLIHGALHKPLETYTALGSFKYSEPYNNDEIQEWIGNKGEKCIYIGQMRKGTEKREGVGICVWHNGSIREGYWLNNKHHGKGRVIHEDGRYEMGEYRKHSLYNGVSLFSDCNEERKTDGVWDFVKNI